MSKQKKKLDIEYLSPKCIIKNKDNSIYSNKKIDIQKGGKEKFKTTNNVSNTHPNIIIPKFIFTFYHDINKIPPKMKQYYNKLIKDNPTFIVKLYDISSGLDFIKKYFNNRVVNAYELLQPYAYKSDLLRYCLLYVKGGIYIDLKYMCIGSFNFKQLLYKEYLVSEPIGVQNCLIVVLPRNKLMNRLIYHIVNNVEKKDYCTGATAITGPILISKLYKKYYPTSKSQIHKELSWTWLGRWPGIHVIKLNGEVILKQYPEYRNELKKFSNQPHYTQLYNEHVVYGEKK